MHTFCACMEMWLCISYNDSGTVLYTLKQTFTFTFHLIITTLGGIISPHFTGEKPAAWKKCCVGIYHIFTESEDGFESA